MYSDQLSYPPSECVAVFWLGYARHTRGYFGYIHSRILWLILKY